MSSVRQRPLRQRSRARLLVGAVLAMLVASSLAVLPATARTSSNRTGASSGHESLGRATERPSAAQIRGRVDVERLAAGGARSKAVAISPAARSAGPSDGDSASGGDVQGTSVGVDMGTTNTTTAPRLTKLPTRVANNNTPNPVVAAGPDHVISSDDDLLRITNRMGSGAVDISYADLFLLSDDTEFLQGQVFYDTAHGRFVAIEASRDCVPGGGAIYGHGYLDIAVSDTANPLGDWSIYYFQYNDQLVWDPGFGMSGNKTVFTTRFHEMGVGCGTASLDTWDATTIGWADLLDGSLDNTYFTFVTTADLEPRYLRPALRHDAASNTIEMLATIYDFDADEEFVSLVRITGPGNDAAIDSVDTMPAVVPMFGIPMHIPQGSLGLTPAHRPISLVADGDRLVMAGTEPCTPTGDSTVRNCVRIVDLDASTETPTRLQDFYIARNGQHTFTPGVGFAESGDLIITFQRAADGVGPNAYVVRQAPADSDHTFSATRTLATATNFYENLNAAERIGLSPDPLVPDAVWVINQVGHSIDPEPDGYAYKLAVAQAATSDGDTFVPLEPLRVLDTRTATGLSGPFLNNVPRTFNVAGAFGGEIPDGAVAVTGNITVADQSSTGYVSVGPSIGVNPTSSTINFPHGDTRANNLTLPLNGDGDLMAVFKGLPGRQTQLILDVTGYFLADDSGSTYEPVTAARVLDTRTGTGLTEKFLVNVPRTFQVTGSGGVPAGAVAVTGNLTVVGQSKAGYVTLAPEPDATPETSTINFPLGDTRANGVTVPLSEDGTLSAVFKASGGSTDLIFDVTGYYVDDLTGLRFYPLNPGRIMDTRFNTLTQLFGQFTSSVPRTLVTGGHFGVPATALAVTGNLTVVGQTKAGYVSITKNPTANPTVSTINFPFGDVRANGVTVPLNATNDLAITYKGSSGAKTHLILDLTGYFK